MPKPGSSNASQPLQDGLSAGRGKKEKAAPSRTTLPHHHHPPPSPSLHLAHAWVVPIILSCRRKGHSNCMEMEDTDFWPQI